MFILMFDLYFFSVLFDDTLTGSDSQSIFVGVDTYVRLLGVRNTNKVDSRKFELWYNKHTRVCGGFVRRVLLKCVVSSLKLFTVISIP